MSDRAAPGGLIVVQRSAANKELSLDHSLPQRQAPRILMLQHDVDGSKKLSGLPPHVLPLFAAPQFLLQGVAHPLFSGEPTGWIPFAAVPWCDCFLTPFYKGWLGFSADIERRFSVGLDQSGQPRAFTGDDDTFQRRLQVGDMVEWLDSSIKNGPVHRQGVVLLTWVRLSNTFGREWVKHHARSEEGELADESVTATLNKLPEKAPVAMVALWELQQTSNDVDGEAFGHVKERDAFHPSVWVGHITKVLEFPYKPFPQTLDHPHAKRTSGDIDMVKTSVLLQKVHQAGATASLDDWFKKHVLSMLGSMDSTPSSFVQWMRDQSAEGFDIDACMQARAVIPCFQPVLGPGDQRPLSLSRREHPQLAAASAAAAAGSKAMPMTLSDSESQPDSKKRRRSKKKPPHRKKSKTQDTSRDGQSEVGLDVEVEEGETAHSKKEHKKQRKMERKERKRVKKLAQQQPLQSEEYPAPRAVISFSSSDDDEDFVPTAEGADDEDEDAIMAASSPSSSSKQGSKGKAAPGSKRKAAQGGATVSSKKPRTAAANPAATAAAAAAAAAAGDDTEDESDEVKFRNQLNENLKKLWDAAGGEERKWMMQFHRDPDCAPPPGLTVSSERALMMRQRFNALSNEDILERLAPLVSCVWHQVYVKLKGKKPENATRYMKEVHEWRDFTFKDLPTRDEQLFECLKWDSRSFFELIDNLADPMWRKPYAIAGASGPSDNLLWMWSNGCRPSVNDGTFVQQWNADKIHQDSRKTPKAREKGDTALAALQSRADAAIAAALKAEGHKIVQVTKATKIQAAKKIFADSAALSSAKATAAEAPAAAAHAAATAAALATAAAPAPSPTSAAPLPAASSKRKTTLSQPKPQAAAAAQPASASVAPSNLLPPSRSTRSSGNQFIDLSEPIPIVKTNFKRVRQAPPAQQLPVPPFVQIAPSPMTAQADSSPMPQSAPPQLAAAAASATEPLSSAAAARSSTPTSSAPAAPTPSRLTSTSSAPASTPAPTTAAVASPAPTETLAIQALQRANQEVRAAAGWAFRAARDRASRVLG